MSTRTGRAPASGDMDAIGRALRQDLETLAAHAPVPPASAVWFRAERRARQDALRRAEQPIWFAERLALVGAGVVIGWAGTFAQEWLNTHDAWAFATMLRVADPGALGGMSALTSGAAVLAVIGAVAGVVALTSAD